MFSCYIITGFAQPTVPTCENNPVDASTRSELNDIQAANNQFLQLYGPMFGFTQANIIDDASNTYNCHAYAYHVSEGGNRVWINNTLPGGDCDATLTNNINQYWKDACIIQVANESNAEKVHYYRGDHSAIRLSNGMYQSKWGNYPLVKHAATDVDYCDPINSRRYYASFKVSNPQLVCSGNTATFTTPDYIGCTFNWTYDTSLLDYVSGQGTKTFVVEPKNSTSHGEAWVKLELTIDLDDDVTREITKKVWVGVPDYTLLGIELDPDGDLLACDYTSAEASYGNPPFGPTAGITEYEWYMPDANDWDIYEETGAGKDMEYVEIEYNDDPPPSQEDIYIRASNACGWSYNWYGETFYVIDNCGGYYMMMSPNPSSGETTVSIEYGKEEPALKSASTSSNFDENEPWVLEVYDAMQNLKVKKPKLKGKSTSINTQGWKEGVYMIRAKYKDKILTGKLVVKE